MQRAKWENDWFQKHPRNYPTHLAIFDAVRSTLTGSAVMAPRLKVTPELRQQCSLEDIRNEWLTLSAISRELKSVISRVLNQFDEKKTFESPASAGRPRKTTMRDGRAMKRYVMKDPFETAAGISRKLKANNNKEVSRFTVSRRLNEFGLKARVRKLK